MNKRMALFIMAVLLTSISLVCARELEKRQDRKPARTAADVMEEIVNMQSDLFVLDELKRPLLEDKEVQRYIELAGIDKQLRAALRLKYTERDALLGQSDEATTKTEVTAAADESTSGTG